MWMARFTYTESVRDFWGMACSTRRSPGRTVWLCEKDLLTIGSVVWKELVVRIDRLNMLQNTLAVQYEANHTMKGQAVPPTRDLSARCFCFDWRSLLVQVGDGVVVWMLGGWVFAGKACVELHRGDTIIDPGMTFWVTLNVYSIGSAYHADEERAVGVGSGSGPMDGGQADTCRWKPPPVTGPVHGSQLGKRSNFITVDSELFVPSAGLGGVPLDDIVGMSNEGSALRVWAAADWVNGQD
ncbi:hypothetical protein C8R43DRAFT_942390 [Mycena crocata]|nr:hypothetical protein C8R43DRAFT_942390 [Mycena crocata]